jgi:ERCC4-type nuclease
MVTGFDDIGKSTAIGLYEAGFKSLEALAVADRQSLVTAPEVGELKAETIQQRAWNTVRQNNYKPPTSEASYGRLEDE